MAGIADTQELQVKQIDVLSFDPLAERLFPSLATGVRWGLERTEKALNILGDPHRSYRTIHVGGTNGKGSVASTLAAALNVAGFRTGCYTSPLLIHEGVELVDNLAATLLNV